MRLTRYPPLPQLLPEGLRLGIIAGKHALLDFGNPYMVHGHPLLLWLNQNPIYVYSLNILPIFVNISGTFLPFIMGFFLDFGESIW